MTRFLFLTFTLLAVLFSSAQARDSLYTASTVVKLDQKKAFSLFGPRSASIKYDSRMIRAAEIAQARARASSTRRCWSYVKTALLEADVIETRPETGYAKQAAGELEKIYGFKKIAVTDPYKAPVGAVLVYGGAGAGHVEIRTSAGFVSDFESAKPSPRPLIGIFVKPS